MQQQNQLPGHSVPGLNRTYMPYWMSYKHLGIHRRLDGLPTRRRERTLFVRVEVISRNCHFPETSMRGDDEKQSTVADLCDKTPGVLRAVPRPSEEDLKAKIEVNIKPRKLYSLSTACF